MRVPRRVRSAARPTVNRCLDLSAPLLVPRHLETRIFVFGSGRSGTTALMAAIAAGTSSQAVFEPLRRGMLPRVDAIVPVHGYPRVAPGGDAPGLMRLMAEILDGRHLSRWSTAHMKIRKLPRARTLVVKEVRTARMAGWLERQFPTLRLRFVLRHPVAVVGSMLVASQGWSRMSYEEIVPAAAEALGVAPSDLANRNDGRSRWLAALWAADTKLALDELSDDSLATGVYYEDMAMRPEVTVDRIGSGLSEFDRDAALEVLLRPSRTASPTFGRGRESVLSAKELADLAAMMRTFGLDMYDVSDPMPLRPMVAGN